MAVYKVTVDEATTVLGVTEAVTILSEQVTGVQGPSGTNGTNGTNGATPVFTSTVPASPAVTIAIGSRTFVVDAGCSFVVGQYVRVADSANPSRYMAGPISAYSGTSLTITSSETAGTGTLGAAIVSLSGTRGFGYGGVSSVTSQSITTGSKTFALTLSLGPHAYIIGERVRIINSTTNFIEGTITAISQTSMTVDVTLANGSGTFTAWTFAVAGALGSTGATGATGATGSSGVVDVDAGELTNTGTSTAAQLGLATAGTAGTYTKVITDTFGRVTTGTTLILGDLPSGVALTGSANAFTVGGHTITNASTGTVPLAITGIISQAVDLFSVSTSATKSFSIGSTGTSTFTGSTASTAFFDGANANLTIRSGTSANTANTSLIIGTGYTAGIGLIVKGFASQTANLQEWQNSAGTITAKVDFSGGINATTIATNNSYVSLVEESSGGRLRLTKMTSAAANPVAGQAKIYLRDGTTAGTLKLVVRAGAAGAETTILDNIPQ
jgi:hypothetical protein